MGFKNFSWYLKNVDHCCQAIMHRSGTKSHFFNPLIISKKRGITIFLKNLYEGCGIRKVFIKNSVPIMRNGYQNNFNQSQYCNYPIFRNHCFSKKMIFRIKEIRQAIISIFFKYKKSNCFFENDNPILKFCTCELILIY